MKKMVLSWFALLALTATSQLSAANACFIPDSCASDLDAQVVSQRKRTHVLEIDPDFYPSQPKKKRPKAIAATKKTPPLPKQEEYEIIKISNAKFKVNIYAGSGYMDIIDKITNNLVSITQHIVLQRVISACIIEISESHFYVVTKRLTQNKRFFNISVFEFVYEFKYKYGYIDCICSNRSISSKQKLCSPSIRDRKLRFNNPNNPGSVIEIDFDDPEKHSQYFVH